MPDIITDGTSPLYLTSYKSYIALLNQSNTDAPVATPMNSNDANYLGDIVWTRSQEGYFVGTLAGAFVEGKTFVMLQNTGGAPVVFDTGNENMPNQIYVVTYYFNPVSHDFIYDDGKLVNTPIEIRVYP